MTKQSFTIEIYEVNKRLVTVKADSEAQAIEQVKDGYYKGRTVLGTRYHSGHLIRAMKPKKAKKKGFIYQLLNTLESKRT